MAFLLLASTARDDVMLLLKEGEQSIVECQRQRQKKPIMARQKLQRQHSEEEEAESSSSSSDPSKLEVKDKTQHAVSISCNPNSLSFWNSHRQHQHRACRRHAKKSSSQTHKHQRHLHLPHLPSLSLSKATSLETMVGTWRQRRRIRASAVRIQAAVDQGQRRSSFLTTTINANPTIILSQENVPVRSWMGRGGFCDVWQVELPDTNNNQHNTPKKKKKKVVLKQLQSSLLFEKNHKKKYHTGTTPLDAFELAAADLRLEALYLARISHPNIVTLMGWVQPSTDSKCDDNDPPNFALPYSDGRYDGFGLLLEPLEDTLDLRLEDWRHAVPTTNNNNNHHPYYDKIHTGRVLHYASQLADALRYLHDRRIVMCDVKPSNVGFVHHHTIKLFDLGLVRELPAILGDGDGRRLFTLPGTFAGTQKYCPGEILVQRQYNCLADVYSFALVLFEMLSLQQPFEDMTLKEHYNRVAKGGERPLLNGTVDVDESATPATNYITDCGYDRPRKVPADFHDLLEHAWDADPQTRWTMEQVRDELDRVKECVDVILPTSRRSDDSESQQRSASSALNNDSHLQDDGVGTAMTADDFELLFASAPGRRN